MMVATRLFTAEHLEAFTENEEKLYEVIDGVLVRNEGVGGRHGNMSVEVGSEIHSFTRPRRLGRVFGADTRFILRRDPDLVLIPDVAFIRAERIPPDGLWERLLPTR
jgi:Uma2 family endonuclease